jgi:hypothetical protein
VDGSDMRWEGVPHEQIVAWVSEGPGAALTEQMEARLKSAAEALNDVSNSVNAAIQRAGGDWVGGAADAAAEAMRVLRDFDDGMHFTSNVSGVRASGQSAGAGFVRANVPPVAEVKPPNPTGGLIDILNTTVDFQRQQAAAKEAEQRARDLMREYERAATARMSNMTPLTPAPQVVLDIAPASPPQPPPPAPRPPIVEPPPRPRDPGDGPRAAGPDGGPDPAQPGPAPSGAPGASGPTQAAVAPAPGPAQVTPVPPGGPAAVPGGSGTTAPLPVGGVANRGPAGGTGSRPFGESPGRGGGAPGGDSRGGGPAGRRPAALGAAAARGATTGHGAVPVGAGSGARPEEDREHRVRYGLPTAEHFEPDDPMDDPHRAGWAVAPEVIGGPGEEGDDHR